MSLSLCGFYFTIVNRIIFREAELDDLFPLLYHLSSGVDASDEFCYEVLMAYLNTCLNIKILDSWDCG